MPICGYLSVPLPSRYHPRYHLITTLQMAKHGLIVYIVGKNTSSARRNVGAAQKLFMLFFLINNPRCFSLSRIKKNAPKCVSLTFHLSPLPYLFHIGTHRGHIHAVASSLLSLAPSRQSLVASSLWPPVASRRQPIISWHPASGHHISYLRAPHTLLPATPSTPKACRRGGWH